LVAARLPLTGRLDWCCLTAHHRTYLEKLVLMM
jgi:hypothetical protein